MAFMKNDLKEEKPDWSLFPFDAAEGVVRILMMGAKKYSRDNWREACNDPEAQRRIFSAIIRHLTALQGGQTLDPESGEHHILHVACNALFLAAFAETRRKQAGPANHCCCPCKDNPEWGTCCICEENQFECAFMDEEK